MSAGECGMVSCQLCGAFSFRHAIMADHDCTAPIETVRCLLGFVWVLQSDGRWLATDERLSQGTPFIVREYDGSESIEELDLVQWVEA
jgi:hypothetical protein